MTLKAMKTSGLVERCARWLLVPLLAAFVSPIGATGQPESDSIYGKFEELSSLRSQGLYDEAIAVLERILSEYEGSEEVLRRAHNNLVFTMLTKGDTGGAEAAAREALMEFPDLTADTMYFPGRINDMYDELRSELFGALKLFTKPDSCRVYLGEFEGFTPLLIDYVAIGEYTVTIGKPGYKQETIPIVIESGEVNSIQITLERERDKKWWAFRLIPAAVAAAIVVGVAASGGGGTEPSPLPEPPPPPGR